MVRTAAPPQLLPYTTEDVLTTATYPNVRWPHNCHSSYTTRVVHTTAIHPPEPGTPTQLSPILHSTGPRQKCHLSYTIRDAHTTTRLLRVTPHRRAVEGAFLVPFAPPFPLPTPPAKKLNWGGRGKEERIQAVQGTTLHIYNHLATFYCKSYRTRSHVSSGSHYGGPWEARSPRTISRACR